MTRRMLGLLLAFVCVFSARGSASECLPPKPPSPRLLDQKKRLAWVGPRVLPKLYLTGAKDGHRAG